MWYILIPCIVLALVLTVVIVCVVMNKRQNNTNNDIVNADSELQQQSNYGPLPTNKTTMYGESSFSAIK